MNLLKICFNWQFQFWYLGARVFSDRPFVQIGPMFGTEQAAREFLEWWLSRRPNKNLYQVV